MKRWSFILIFFHGQATFSAFTAPQNFSGGSVEQNSRGTWCFYPTTDRTNVTCQGPLAHFNAVVESHLRHQVSVGYYNPAGERLGGAGYVIPAPPTGRIQLCVSGDTGGVPQTRCETVTGDNEIGSDPSCTVAQSQQNVTDRCYVPVRTTSSVPMSVPMSLSMSATSPVPMSMSVISHMATWPPAETTRSTNATGAVVTQVTATVKGNGLTLASILVIICGVLSVLVTVPSAITAIRSWRRKRRSRRLSMKTDTESVAISKRGPTPFPEVFNITLENLKPDNAETGKF